MTDDLDKQLEHVARHCIAVRVRLLNRVITGLYDEALRPLGVKVSQMNILVATARLGVARPAKVCELLHLDVSTLSRNVERLITQGWLEVVPEVDARTQPFQLTAQGRKLLARALPAWTQAQEKAVALLGEQGVAALQSLARRADQNLHG